MMWCNTLDSFGHSPTNTVSSTSELRFRFGWATKSQGQAANFLRSQKLTWTITDWNDNVIQRVPNPEYGDLTYRSTQAEYREVTDANGKLQKIWFSNYLYPTGLFVPAGESVTIQFTLTANSRTDDGFGFAYNPFEVISTGSCTVTGV